MLLEFDQATTAADAIATARQRGLERPTYEDALHFGIEHPDMQTGAPVLFLHDPWFGFFGRRDVICLWSNAGRRELGLEGFDEGMASALPLRLHPARLSHPRSRPPTLHEKDPPWPIPPCPAVTASRATSRS